ncbi:MAG: leucine-rich repeat domain-containing protein [Anaeroplasma sp.]
MRRFLYLICLLSSVFLLVSCSLDDYINHFFEKNKIINSIEFLQKEYIVTKNSSIKVYVKVDLMDYNYLDKIKYSLSDSSYGNVSNEGVITPNDNFIDGKTTIRARIEELKIEAFADVYFSSFDYSIKNVLINESKTDKITINNTNIIRFIGNDQIDHNFFHVEFSNENVIVENTSKNGISIKSSILGKIDYNIYYKNTQRVIYRGSLYSTLVNPIVEERARMLLSKNKDEVVTIEELSTITNLDDGECFCNKNISDFSDFNYFPLITSLNLSNNNIKNVNVFSQNLEYLNLSHNTISSISFPENSELSELNLSYNNFDLSNFSDRNLHKLKKLYLNNNYSSDYSLKMVGNENLIYLNIDNCSLNNIKLENVNSLEYFLAADNKISDLSFFTNVSLKVLDIANNSISTLDFLEGNNSLIELYIGGNSISTSELSHISNETCQNIIRLNISITGNINLDELKKFVLSCSKSLVWLQMYGLRLKDISWVNAESLPKLIYIKISHNSIVDYSSLNYISVVVKDFNDNRQE